jgi:hypothetical protein
MTAVTDAMTASYWQWALGLTSANLMTAGGVIHTDPASGVAFLMDPTDASAFPNDSNQTTVGMLSPNQQVLIPLFISIAEANTCHYCNTTLPQIILTSKKNYLLGRITSQVSINGVSVSPTNGGFLDVDVCLCNNTTNVTYTYHAPSTSAQGLQHTSSTTFSTFILSTSEKSSQGTFVLGSHPNASSTGFWTVISRSDAGDGKTSWSNGETISYSTKVVANTIQGCTPPVFNNNINTTIKYTVTGLAG